MIDWKELGAPAGDEKQNEDILEWADLIPQHIRCEQLSVDIHASNKEIRRAYRRLAILHHPDLQPAHQRAEAEQRMKQVNEAYQFLRQRKQA